MSQSQPPITGTAHTLPFDRLSPRDFERLCLWLIQREGYEHAAPLGAADLRGDNCQEPMTSKRNDTIEQRLLHFQASFLDAVQVKLYHIGEV